MFGNDQGLRIVQKVIQLCHLNIFGLWIFYFDFFVKFWKLGILCRKILDIFDTRSEIFLKIMDSQHRKNAKISLPKNTEYNFKNEFRAFWRT